MQGLQELVDRLQDVKDGIHGCESLSVASSDGLVLATTHDEARQGEHLAALTSFLLSSSAKGLSSYKAGRCRALDYRGDRQILVIRLDAVDAFLACVLHPGAQAIGLDDPAIRSTLASIPGALHGAALATKRYYLERDSSLRITVTHGGVLLGSSPHCDLILTSPRISPRHALVELVGGRVLVGDLGSEHGTKVNGRKINDQVELQPGDRISLPGASGFTLLELDERGRFAPSRSQRKAKKQKRKQKSSSKSKKQR